MLFGHPGLHLVVLRQEELTAEAIAESAVSLSIMDFMTSSLVLVSVEHTLFLLNACLKLQQSLSILCFMGSFQKC